MSDLIFSLKKNIVDSYKVINFQKRFECLLEEHKDFSNRLNKIENKELIEFLKTLGYNFRIFNPGSEFYFEEKFDSISLQFSFNKKGGVPVFYIHLYYDGFKIDFPPNFAFIYRSLISNNDILLNPIVFTNMNELQFILVKVLKIYEDFKKELLIRVLFPSSVSS